MSWRTPPTCRSMPTTRPAMPTISPASRESVRLAVEDRRRRACRSRTAPTASSTPSTTRWRALRAARGAIDKAGGDVLLVGRAECFLLGRPDLDETIARLKAYANAGADCLYCARHQDPRADRGGGERSRAEAGQCADVVGRQSADRRRPRRARRAPHQRRRRARARRLGRGDARRQADRRAKAASTASTTARRAPSSTRCSATTSRSALS